MEERNGGRMGTQSSRLPIFQPNDSSQKPIAKIEYYIGTTPAEETSEYPSILRNQTVVSIGDTLSRQTIQQSIKALYATQQYSQIQVYLQDTSDGIVLTYQLTPFARIEQIVFSGIRENEVKDTIENAMHSKPGGTYVPTIVKTDVQRIKDVCQAYGYFDANVTVSDTLTEAGTLTYQIAVGDASWIKTLQIQNSVAVSSNNLKAVCNFSRLLPIYNKSGVETDVASMLALYRKNNYPTATIVPNFNHETGVLQFQVTEGREVQFNFVRDVGEVPLSLQDAFREDIVSLINTASSSVWEPQIRAYFKAKGYHDTTVVVEILDPDSVLLRINLGLRYVVKELTFSGNRAFSDTQLKREMTMKPIGGFLRNLQADIARVLFQREQRRFFYEVELDTDRRRLSILYEKAGHPKATITTTLDKQNPNNRRIGEISIHVSITEEYKEMIHRCAVGQNNALDTPTLLTRLASELPFPQPNTSLTRKAYSDAILKAYYELGYIDAVISSAYVSETADPVFRIPGNFSEPLADRRLPPEIRSEFARRNLTLVGVYITTQIGDHRWSLQDIEGNPRYTLKQEAAQLEVYEHGVLHLTVETEGEQVVFGKFYFIGDTDVVKQHVLDREIAHLEGTLWTSEKLSKVLQNLYNLGLFRSVHYERFLQPTRSIGAPQSSVAAGSPRPYSDSDHLRLRKTNDVLIQVEKQKPRTYSVSSGYSFAEGVRGTVALTDSNFLFDRNIRGRVRSRLGWRDELGYLFDATLTEPWLIGRTRGSLQVLAKKLEVDDNVRALQASFILSRYVSESHHLDLRYSYRDLNQPVPPVRGSPAGIGVPIEQNPFSTTVSSIRFSWTYDNRERYLNPTGGMLNDLTLEYAGGNFLRGETSFIKTTTDTRYYQKLIGGLVVATAVRFGITTGLRSNRRAELISFERFWAGGGTTVRGYAERSLGPKDSTGIHRGDVQFIFNTELRFPIYRIVRGALFFDAGNVWDALEDINTTQPLPSSVGAGLYLDLGALTAGIDYAVPLVSTPGALDPNRAVHLRVGSTF
ncbi:MAG: BamA/TamA family outer membrane protein [Candidatus Poribacteria bacterium]|nr:BamA/TamA family outer membrane protein [Candidatus Poribacteria bacterium]